MEESELPYDILRFDYKERLNDRFLATHLHRFEMFNRPVAVAIVIEILNPWHPTSEVGQKIINSIVREFSRRQGQSFLARFEASLKFTNPIIKDAVTKLDTPVSCVAMLIEADQVHCAGIGSAKLGLERNGRLAAILGGQNGSEVFSSVTSGDLREGDWLMLANQDFYGQLETFEPTSWEINDTTVIANQLVDQKSSHRDEFWAGLLLRYSQDEETANQTVFWEAGAQIRRREKPTVSALESLRRFQPLLAPINTTFTKVLTKIRELKINPSPISRWNWRLVIPVAVVLLGLILFFGLRQNRQPTVASTVDNTLVTEVNSAPAEARLQTLVQKFNAKDYTSLSQTDKDQLKTALLASRISLVDPPPPATNAPETIAAITNLAGEPLLVDGQGQVWLFKNNLLTKATQNQLIPQPLSIAAFSETNIIVSDKIGNVWQIDASPASPTALPQPKLLPTTAKVVRSYLNNLYLTSSDSKTTYRVANFTNSLTGAAVYNNGSALALSTISDLAVNGSAIVVDNAGHLASFVKTKAGPVGASLPVSDGNYFIGASEAQPQIFVGSGRIIYVLDAAGAVQKTIFLATDNKITGLAIDFSQTNSCWFSSGTSLYHLSLTS